MFDKLSKKDRIKFSVFLGVVVVLTISASVFCFVKLSPNFDITKDSDLEKYKYIGE